MFAVGDTVVYTGRAPLNPNIELIISHVVGEYVFINDYINRYKASSFRKVGDVNPADGSLLGELKRKLGNKDVGVCSYALEFSKGHKRFHVADVCHARMTFDIHNRRDNEKDLVAVALNVSGHIKRMLDLYPKHVENYKRCVEYILTESPWKSAFVPKPLEEVYASGVYLDVTKEYWFCVAAAIALRTASEHYTCLPLFRKLLNLNYNPNVAYIVSQFCKEARGKMSFMRHTGGHHVMSNTLTAMDSFVSFFNGGEHKETSGISYEAAAGQRFQIQALIGGSYPKPLDHKEMYDTIIQLCAPVVSKYQPEWGAEVKYIDVSDINQLVFLANCFSKVIK